MLAYHNDPTIKKQILEQLQGSSWNVSIEEYETRFGIPKVLAYLEDAIFKGLPNDLAKNWPIRFMSAIQVGADLSTIWRDFVIWLLVDPVDGVIKYTQPGTEAHDAILRVAQLYQDGYTQKQMLDAAYDAYAVYSADYSALSAFAFNAAYYDLVAYAASNIAAYSAYAAYSAAYAVSAAAYDVSAAYAVSATYAVSAAAHAHAHASNAAVSAAHVAASNAAYIKMSNKLIELLEKQEVKNEEIIHLVARPPKTSIG